MITNTLTTSSKHSHNSSGYGGPQGHLRQTTSSHLKQIKRRGKYQLKETYFSLADSDKKSAKHQLTIE